MAVSSEMGTVTVGRTSVLQQTVNELRDLILETRRSQNGTWDMGLCKEGVQRVCAPTFFGKSRILFRGLSRFVALLYPSLPPFLLTSFLSFLSFLWRRTLRAGF